METVDHWMKVEICWDGDGRCAWMSFDEEEHARLTNPSRKNSSSRHRPALLYVSHTAFSRESYE